MQEQEELQQKVKKYISEDVVAMFFSSEISELYASAIDIVYQWNEDRGFNALPYSFELEKDLLNNQLEDLGEAFLSHSATDVLVAYAGMLFVSFGTIGKLQDIEPSSVEYKDTQDSIARVSPLRQTVINFLSDKYLFNPNDFAQLELATFNIVLEANRQLGNEIMQGRYVKSSTYDMPFGEIFDKFYTLNNKE